MVDGVDAPASNDTSQTENEVPRRLQAMGFAELLDTTFSLYRAHFRTFFGIATLYFIAMLMGVSISFFLNGVERDTNVVIWILTIGVIFCVSIFVVSAIVFASVQAYLDGKIKTGTVLKQAKRQFFRCLISAIIFGLIISLLTFIILLVCVILLSRSSMPSSIVALGVFLLIFSAASFFITYWCFYISTISAEQATVLQGLGRSDELIRGRWWRINGVMIAILLLHFSVGLIFRIAFGILLTLTELAEVGEFVDTVQWLMFFQLPINVAEFHLATALMYLINLGIDAFTLPIWVIGCTLLYFDQRIRREGFDIEVMATR